MAKKRNIIVGQSGGPTAVINSSLAGVYKNAIERGFDKVYGMLHGIQGLLDEQYIDLSTQIHSELDQGGGDRRRRGHPDLGARRENTICIFRFLSLLAS